MAIVVDRKTKLTYEDYLQFPEDERRPHTATAV